MTHGNNATVLIVDDDQGIRQGLKALLETAGYQAVCAEDGWKALELLRAGLVPRCVVLDLMMPKLNGWDFMQELVNDARLPRIPNIVATAAAPHWGFPVPDAHVLRKPLDIDRLLDLIGAVTTTPGSPPMVA